MVCYNIWTWYVLVGWAGLGLMLLLFVVGAFLWDGED